MWLPDGLAQQHPASFCECDRDWADPECRTPRKSQAVAYFLSVFFGFLGADLFYLGYYGSAMMKLLTLGGGGIWWVVDIIRVGSSPVATPRFRVAADLPHWAYAVSTITFAMLLGFLISYIITLRIRAQRRKQAMLLQADEEAVLGGFFQQKLPSGVSAKPSAFTSPADYRSSNNHVIET
jgi:TM2 domain-containing membrane protein YozV